MSNLVTAFALAGDKIVCKMIGHDQFIVFFNLSKLCSENTTVNFVCLTFHENVSTKFILLSFQSNNKGRQTFTIVTFGACNIDNELGKHHL